MIILDFDQTLFDTHAFKHARAKVLAEKHGVSEDLFWKTYFFARDQHLSGYSDNSHAEALAGEGYEVDGIKESLYAVSNASKQFIYPGVVDGLEKLRSAGKKIMLCTFGDPAHQERVVRGTGLHAFFDRVLYTNKAKHLALAEEFSSAPAPVRAWFVNDKIEETFLVKSAHAWCVPILHKPPEADESAYHDSQMLWFGSFPSIVEYLLSVEDSLLL